MRGTGEGVGGGCAPSRKSNNIKPILGMPYAHKVCTVFIKHNFHENGLTFVFH